MTREELQDKMKDLPNPPSRVHLIQQVYDIMNNELNEKDKQIAELTLKIKGLESDCDAYNYSQRTYQEQIAELKKQLDYSENERNRLRNEIIQKCYPEDKQRIFGLIN